MDYALVGWLRIRGGREAIWRRKDAETVSMKKCPWALLDPSVESSQVCDVEPVADSLQAGTHPHTRIIFKVVEYTVCGSSSC